MWWPGTSRPGPGLLCRHAQYDNDGQHGAKGRKACQRGRQFNGSFQHVSFLRAISAMAIARTFSLLVFWTISLSLYPESVATDFAILCVFIRLSPT